MKKNIFYKTALWALAALALAGCGGERKGGAENIVYGITSQPDHLDPYEAASADSRFILFNIFEGLFKPTPDGRLVPAVAESYTVSDDFRTWTIQVKKDVVFHNGDAVTAKDVEYSLRRAAEKKFYGMQAISGIERAGDYTVILRLSEPDPEFYYYLTSAVVPAGYESQNEAPVGTGPFRFVSFDPQYELVLEKHDAYRQSGLPRSSGVTFRFKADYNAVMLDLLAGSVNAGTVDTTGLQQLDPSGFNIVGDKTNMVQTLCLNNAAGPLADKRVRQAISYAVDVDQIVSLAHNGRADRAATPVIPALAYCYPKHLEGRYARSLQTARSLLKEAGYEKGFPLEIAVPAIYEPHVATAEVLVNQLKEIGIEAELRLVDWPTWLEEIYTGRKYQATVISIDGVTLSPRSYLFRYESGDPQNFINYKNAEFDGLYAKTLSTVSEEERTAAYIRMQEIIVEDAASVYLCDIHAPRVFKKNITGFKGYPLSVFDASLLEVE